MKIRGERAEDSPALPGGKRLLFSFGIWQSAFGL
jgi:hypothetical protein